MKRLSLITVLALSLGILSCGKGDPKEDLPEAVLRSVDVSVTEDIWITKSGSADISFRVNDAAFPFSMTQDVNLFVSSGQPASDFSLTDVRQDGGMGSYSARIQDNGYDKEYSTQVRLGVRSAKGKEEYVYSSPFTVNRDNGKDLHTGLPVLYLDTDGGEQIVSKTEYLAATLEVWDGEAGLGEPLVCSVRGRGNTTWTWPKKPYLVKLDKKESLLGMNKHKRWVLLANFMDKTLMRNLVAMKVSSMTSLDWTPSCKPVELVLNGKHVGSYLLIEQVRVDKNRVPVTEMTPEDDSGEAVTGGYLMECDFHYDNEVQWLDHHGRCNKFQEGIPFAVKYPDPEDITQSQLSYIKQYIYDTAEAIYGPDFKDPEKGYAAYIDVDSFIDYWIVYEVMGNLALSNPGSIFCHKDRGGKLKAGPCWDFDWGVLSFYTAPKAKTGLLHRQAMWYARLFEDPVFLERARARYQELLPKLETVPEYMESLRKTLSASAKLNFRMWDPTQDSSQNGGKIINGDEDIPFDEAVDRLKSNYIERLQVISKSL